MSRWKWVADDPMRSSVSWTVRGIFWRLLASVLAPIAWLCVTLVFYGFWARGLSLVQDIIVGLVSVLTLFGFLLALWVSFGIRLHHRWIDG